MASTTHHTAHRAGLFSAIGIAVMTCLSAVVDALVAVAEANPKLRELERLNRMSDAQLAERGLTRERIFDHVFRSSGCI